MKSKKPKATEPVPTEDTILEAELNYMSGVTMAILEVKAHIWAIENVLISVASQSGLDTEPIRQELKNIRRDWLQKALAKAEDANPGLAARLDNRPLDDV